MLTLEAMKQEHVRLVSDLMREEEKTEVKRSHDDSPFNAVYTSWLQSLCTTGEAYLVKDEAGTLVFAFGIVGPEVEESDEYYCLWLIGTDNVKKKPKSFWKFCREMKPLIVERYGRLKNWIDAEYAQSLRWARHLGCEIKAPAPLPWHNGKGAFFCEVILDGSSRHTDRAWICDGSHRRKTDGRRTGTGGRVQRKTSAEAV